MTTADAPRPRLELTEVSKHFGLTRALDRVSFELRAGEVHVLAGENGAGKTTLIRILSGAVTDYSGSMRIDGCPVRLRGPADAARAGIATIYQELSLVQSLSVADNLTLGDLGMPFAPLSRGRVRATARRALERLELDVDPEAAVDSLPLAQRQLVEIARALARDAQVLILDEPTSALRPSEARVLFEHIDNLRAQGAGLVYISHRLEEIYRVADRITVLRDGRVITTAAARDLPQPELVAAMVGRELAGSKAIPKRPAQETILEVTGLTCSDRGGRRPRLHGMSWSLCGGEILGLAGLQGCGASEALQALCGGYGRSAQGQVRLATRPHRIANPKHALDSGLVLLDNDRRQSVLAELSVLHNASLSSLARFSRGGFVQGRRERAAVAELFARLRLRVPSLGVSAGRLSGGNQQKLALARCLLARPRVLLLDEPTRGIDVAAKADVYELIRALAQQGLAIMLVASELDELIELCDRILVLARGRIVSEFSRHDFSRTRILEAAMTPDGAAA